MISLVLILRTIKLILYPICVCSILLISNYGFSQEKYYSQQFDNSAGLSNSCLNTIFQDSENLMWFGTWDGLNVYDGSSFNVFNYSSANSVKSIGNNIVYDIKEDKQKDIWIATIEGLSRYNKLSGNFSHYFYRKSVNGKAVDKGYLLAMDSKGGVYSTPKNETHLQAYDSKSNSFKKIQLNNERLGKIVKFLFDEQNRLYILKISGVLEVFKAKGTGFDKIEEINLGTNISDFFLVNNKVFFTAANQLYRIEPNFSYTKLTDLEHAVRAMTYFNNKYILAWATKGLKEFDENFNPSNTLIGEMDYLKDVRITSFKRGNQNILWIGTDGFGVIKVSNRFNYFGLVKKLPDGKPINIPIRAFNEVNNQLWIGTKGNGIIQIDQIANPKSKYAIVKNFNSVSDVLDNCVYAIEKGKDDYVYVGSDALGIHLYDRVEKEWFDWKSIAGSYKFQPFNSVHCILVDDDGSIWLGLESYGLIHLKIEKFNNKPKISYLKRYPYTGNNLGPVNNVIYSLINGKDNQLYVGCRYGGLSVFDKKTQKFNTFKAFSYEGSLSNNDVLSLYKDKENILWIGTSYGLNYIPELELKKTKPVFKKFTTEDGLPNNTIHAISQDNEGFIWASTNKGLVKLDVKKNKIIRFKESDGLQSDEFSDNAVFKNEQGLLFFGGIYGFNYFLPKNIPTSVFQPNLLISDLQLAGKTVDKLGFKVLLTTERKAELNYVLEPGNNFFDLKVKAVDFTNFEKCQYAYFLEGNDKEWHYLGDDNRISYSNIPAGKYKLKLKWSNGGGLWTNEVTAFDIEIKQYFWLTWPAFLCYALLLFIGGYLFHLYRKNKLTMEYELATEHLLREKDEELHQGQLNFFTNIAHELQTPLTLISGALERYFLKAKVDFKSDSGYFLSIVNQQASRLNYLVYQLLEFRKAEAGHVKNHYSYLNVSILLENIAKLFSGLNDKEKFDFKCEIEPDLKLWTDKDKLEKIIFNLLSNAFKHSDLGETIVIKVLQSKDKKELLISVANSGNSLSEEELKSLFDRFFVIDDTQKSKISTGIGLALTRELVNLLGGKIEVNTKDGWISFNLFLPVSNEGHLQDTEPESLEKLEKPSYLLTSIAMGDSAEEEVVIANNNKQSVINSFEKEEKKTILIIEDEPSIRYLLKDILKDTYIVYEASNGKKALEMMRRVIPNLIVSDIMMPDMSGLEVCEIVKSTPETCHIPFIILSARGTLDQKTEGYEAGADAYIPKPFSAEHLLVRIRKLLDYQQRLYDLFSKSESPIRIPEVGMKDNDKQFLENAINFIEANLDNEELDALMLEQHLGMSKANFYRKLKTLSNMTPGELIKSIRLQEAASQLENSDSTVSEIFYRTGFSNQSHFYREFKKKYNCSPAEYRAKFRLS